MKQIHNVRIGCTVVMTALFLSIFFSSCSNDEPAMPSADGIITFTTPTEIGGATSRVTYTQEKESGDQPARIKVKWVDGDKVDLLNENKEVVATFIATDVNGSTATFKCFDAKGIEDRTNFTGKLQYKISGDGYTQKGNDNTDHLVYANTIVAPLKNENLNKELPLNFVNTTAIFRVMVKPKVKLASNTNVSLKINGGTGWGIYGKTLTINLTQDITTTETLIAYVAVPAGDSNGYVSDYIGFVLTPNSSKPSNSYHYYFTMKGKTYAAGKEYTANLSSSGIKSFDSYYYNDHEYVDLGLGETMWATMNVVAANVEGDGYGDYFTWNHIEPVGESPNSRDNKLITLNDVVSNSESTNFEDVANYYWQGDWATPSQEQCNDLLRNCNWTWNSSINCYMVSSTVTNNDAMILLPAAGYIEGEEKKGLGDSTDYWTLTQGSGDLNQAYCIQITNENVGSARMSEANDQLFAITNACPIRPVFVKNN